MEHPRDIQVNSVTAPFDGVALLEGVLANDNANSDAQLFGGEPLLHGREVAQALGMSLRQFNRLIEDGVGPPYYRFGKKLRRFRPSIVRIWAASRIEITVAPTIKSNP